MAKIEGFMIERFSLDKKAGLVNSQVHYAYNNEQVLTWAFEELATAARTGVGLGSWPSRREGIRGTALRVIDKRLDLVSWAMVQERNQGLLDRAALQATKALIEFGTDKQKANAFNVIDEAQNVIRDRSRWWRQPDPKYSVWWRFMK